MTTDIYENMKDQRKKLQIQAPVPLLKPKLKKKKKQKQTKEKYNKPELCMASLQMKFMSSHQEVSTGFLVVIGKLQDN